MSRLRSEKGITLIEMMVALAVIGVMMGSIIVGYGAIKRSQLRSAANQLAATIRHSRDKAITTNKFYRLKLDLERGVYQLESSDRAPLLHRYAEGVEVEPEAQRPGSANPDTTLDDPTQSRPASFEAFQDATTKPVQFKKGIEFKAVYTPRQAEPKTAGKAYLYFFPDGHTEQAWICMGRPNEKASEYLLEVQPLTGTVIILSSCANPPK